MTNIVYKLVESPNGDFSGSIVNLETSEIRMFDNQNPLYNLIIDQLKSGNVEEAFRSTDIKTYLMSETMKISENLRYDNHGQVFFQEALLPLGISKTLIQALTEGVPEGVKAIANFIERVLVSTTNTSREALFSWIKDRHLSLTEDGCFIAYKGVMLSGNTPVSITSGPGYVNGEYFDRTHLDNSIGNVVSIDRNYVEQEPGRGCGPGLHAGTYEYAEGFAMGVVLAVKIKPENVVSVPVDCQFQKLRVCEYEVIGAVETKSMDVVF